MCVFTFYSRYSLVYYVNLLTNYNHKTRCNTNQLIESSLFRHTSLISWQKMRYFQKLIRLLFLLPFHWQKRKNLTALNIYTSKVNNRNARKECEICSRLTRKTPERRHWVSLLLTLNIIDTFFNCFYCWVCKYICLLGEPLIFGYVLYSP